MSLAACLVSQGSGLAGWRADDGARANAIRTVARTRTVAGTRQIIFITDR